MNASNCRYLLKNYLRFAIITAYIIDIIFLIFDRVVQHILRSGLRDVNEIDAGAQDI